MPVRLGLAPDDSVNRVYQWFPPVIPSNLSPYSFCQGPSTSSSEKVKTFRCRRVVAAAVTGGRIARR